MIDLRVVLAASPAMIRAWLFGFVDRALPIHPDPAGWGQPHMSRDGFITDATMRPQPVPAEIEAAGGFCVGLDMAYGVGNGLVQPMGPVIVFMVLPVGHQRSEVRIFFPLGTDMESRQRVIEVLKATWPEAEIYGDYMPWWGFQNFNLRALFEALATGAPPPPDAPPRRPRALPWRDPLEADYKAEPSQGEIDQASEGPIASVANSQSADPLPPALKGRPREIVILLRKGRTDVEIAGQLGIRPRSVAKRIVEARREFGAE